MGLSAHAYLVRGSDGVVEEVLALIRKEGIDTAGNPDVFVRTYSNFTIDDARQLRERAALKAVGTRGRIFILAAPTVPSDAQNALLKTFEDPPPGAKFFLIVSAPETLLATLRSRVQMLEVEASSGKEIVDAKAFLKATPEKRIEMLKPFLEKGDDEKRDLAGTLSFLSALEKEFAKLPRENAVGIQSVYRARKYITDRGALAKTLLEQVALLTPKMLV